MKKELNPGEVGFETYINPLQHEVFFSLFVGT